MEDYVMREIDKIGKILEAIFRKLSGLKNSGLPGIAVYETAKVELVDALDLDVEKLLTEENIVSALVMKHGFSNENLDKFAELLFDLFSASKEKTIREKLIASIHEIYNYLEKNGTTYSLNRHYILQELNKMANLD